MVDVEPPDGSRFEHHVVRLQRVILAVALRAGGSEVLMLRRHRFVTDQVGWELPGGIVDGNEDSVTTAARETEEETGYRPVGAGRKLVEFQPMIGMVDTPHEVWVFDQVVNVGEPTDAVEAGTVGWIPLSDVVRMIDSGEVLGGGSVTGLLRYLVDHPQD
ncbi:NUDIX hydrolase [Nakamurella deserti]|uniref:NUDIX hydrolase n=1 Tax=Nakamurella deserti TaxID=2164074 RepID=UPI000DBE19CA|nr:NUDIX hydrolase [Nakamurella deserti]